MNGTNDTNLKGKTVLITGATNGIGLELANALAAQGAELYLTCRNTAKGEGVVQAIARDTGNSNVHLIEADFSSLAGARQAAEGFLNTGKPLHILISNAAVMNLRREVTVDGFEEMFAVNHLAPFLLVNLLLEHMQKNGGERIILTSSDAHRFCDGVNFDDLSFEDDFKAFKVYGHSKLGNILFVHELANRLGKDASITVNSFHPGAVATGLGMQNGWIGVPLGLVMKLFFRTPKKGAETGIYLATSPKVATTSGKYFIDRKVAKTKPWARDGEVAKRLWEVSADMAGL